MKSLKRTLSLVLALVMVLGLFGGLSMTASASSFSDDADVQYKEAVDVMTGIGAINGMGDGTFKPKADITRAEAAKMVAYTVLGAETAKGLTGVSTQFTDVPADKYKWAIPSIEYLTNKGVINGMGDGTFKPEDPVTGYEIGKMLLCALGYGKNKEFVGKGWDLQVAVYGTQKGIFKDRVNGASDMDEPASREEVALYCLNTIQQPMVEYLETLKIYRNETTTISGSSVTATMMNTIYYPNLEKIEPTKTGTLFTKEKGVDAMGNPATNWVFKGESVGAYAAEAAVTYTTAKTSADDAAMTKELNGITVPNAGGGIKSTKNGNVNLSADIANAGGAPAAVSAANLDAIQALTGNGRAVSIYVNDKKEMTAVTQVRADVAYVGAPDPSTGAITLTSKNDSVSPLSASYTIEKDDDFYSLVSGLEKDTRVLVTPVHDGTDYSSVIKSIVPATVVTGFLSARGGTDTTNKNDYTYTVDGKTYSVAADRYKTGKLSTLDANIKEDVTLYLDTYGYVVDASTPVKAAESTIFTAIEAYSSLVDGKIVDMVNLLGTNGEVKSVAVTDINNAVSGTLTLNKFFDVDDNNNGTFTLNAALDPVTDGTGSDSVDKKSAKNTVIEITGADGTEKELIKSGDKKLTVDSNRSSSDGDHFFGNYFAEDVKFIYYKNDNTNHKTEVVSVVEGVQTVKGDNTTTGVYAVVEERATATDPTANLVTAVFLPDSKLTTPVDTSKVVLAGAQKNFVNLENTTTKTQVAVPNYTMYVNGVAQEVATADSVTTGCFYMLAENTTVPGSYKLTAYVPTGTNAKIESGVIKGGSENTLNIETAKNTTKQVGTKSASFYDIRSDAQKKANPLAMTVSEIISKGGTGGTYENGVNVSVLYDTKTGEASVVYVTSVRKDVKELSANANISGVTNAGTYSIALDKRYVASGDTIRVAFTLSALPGTGYTDTVSITGATVDSVAAVGDLPAGITIDNKSIKVAKDDITASAPINFSVDIVISGVSSDITLNIGATTSNA